MATTPTMDNPFVVTTHNKLKVYIPGLASRVEYAFEGPQHDGVRHISLADAHGFTPGPLVVVDSQKLHALIVQICGSKAAEPCTRCANASNSSRTKLHFRECRILPIVSNACSECLWVQNSNLCSLSPSALPSENGDPYKTPRQPAPSYRAPGCAERLTRASYSANDKLFQPSDLPPLRQNNPNGESPRVSKSRPYAMNAYMDNDALLSEPDDTFHTPVKASKRSQACRDCRKSRRRCVHDVFGNEDPAKIEEGVVPKLASKNKRPCTDSVETHTSKKTKKSPAGLQRQSTKDCILSDDLPEDISDQSPREHPDDPSDTSTGGQAAKASKQSTEFTTQQFKMLSSLSTDPVADYTGFTSKQLKTLQVLIRQAIQEHDTQTKTPEHSQIQINGSEKIVLAEQEGIEKDGSRLSASSPRYVAVKRDNATVKYEGELGRLKKLYSAKIVTIKEMFPDCTDQDIVSALQESKGDLEGTIDRISEDLLPNGAAQHIFPTKGESRSLNFDAKTPDMPDTQLAAHHIVTKHGSGQGPRLGPNIVELDDD